MRNLVITTTNNILHDELVVSMYESVYTLDNLFSYYFEEEFSWDITDYSVDTNRYLCDIMEHVGYFISDNLISENVGSYIANIKFNGVAYSPRFYNYSVDSGDFDIEVNVATLIDRYYWLKDNHRETLEDYERDTFRASYFISNFPTYLEEYDPCVENIIDTCVENIIKYHKDISHNDVINLLMLVFRVECELFFEEGEIEENLMYYIFDNFAGNTGADEYIELEFRAGCGWMHDFLGQSDEEKDAEIKNSKYTEEDLQQIIDGYVTCNLDVSFLSQSDIQCDYTNFKASDRYEAYVVAKYLDNQVNGK